MKKGKEHNDLDNFLKESFEGHTIEPAPELWDKIESRFQPKVVPMQSFVRLKVVLYASVAIIAGLVLFMLLPEKQAKPEAPLTIEIKKETAQPEEAKQTEDIAQIEEPIIVKTYKTNIVNEADELTKEEENQLASVEMNNTKSETSAIKNQTQKSDEFEKVPQALKTEKTGISEEKLVNEEKETVAELKKEEVEETPDLSALANNNRDHEAPVETTEEKAIAEISNSVDNKKSKDSKVKSNNKKRSSSKRLFSNKQHRPNKNYTNYTRSGKILKDFTLKVNFTPTITALFVTDEDSDIPNFQKLDTDNPGFTFNGGFELEYALNDNWAVYTGLKTYYFKQSFEEYTYNVPSPLPQDQKLKTLAGNYLVNNAGNGNLPGTAEVDAILRIRYIDIPLIARYQVNNVFFDAGVHYNYMIDNYSNIKQRNNLTDLTFERNGGIRKHAFGLTAGIGFKKTFESGMRMEFGPEIKVNLNNFYSNEELIGIPVFGGFRAVMCLDKYYSK